MKIRSGNDDTSSVSRTDHLHHHHEHVAPGAIQTTTASTTTSTRTSGVRTNNPVTFKAPLVDDQGQVTDWCPLCTTTSAWAEPPLSLAVSEETFPPPNAKDSFHVVNVIGASTQPPILNLAPTKVDLSEEMAELKKSKSDNNESSRGDAESSRGSESWERSSSIMSDVEKLEKAIERHIKKEEMTNDSDEMFQSSVDLLETMARKKEEKLDQLKEALLRSQERPMDHSKSSMETKSHDKSSDQTKKASSRGSLDSSSTGDSSEDTDCRSERTDKGPLEEDSSNSAYTFYYGSSSEETSALYSDYEYSYEPGLMSYESTAEEVSAYLSNSDEYQGRREEQLHDDGKEIKEYDIKESEGLADRKEWPRFKEQTTSTSEVRDEIELDQGLAREDMAFGKMDRVKAISPFNETQLEKEFTLNASNAQECERQSLSSFCPGRQGIMIPNLSCTIPQGILTLFQPPQP